MTPEQLAALKALADAATPGPWEEVAESGEWWITGPDIYNDAVMTTNASEISQADADFICAAREAVPALLAEVERLRADNADLRAALSALTADMERLRVSIVANIE